MEGEFEVFEFEENLSIAETVSNRPKKQEPIPHDLLKSYFFGCGPVHPLWLQKFANKKFFTFLSCIFTCLYSSVVSGFISVVLSTIQTRYHFTSLAAGFIVIAYDVSAALSITFVTYFANSFHKPRILGIGCLLLGITGFLFASPQFLFGEYKSGSRSVLHEQCLDNRTVTVECSSANSAAYIIFVLSSISLSLPSSVLHTMTTSYIDEIVYPRFVSLHIGTFNIFLVLGPAIGYFFGSACLSVYVDPWIETTLDESDPAWVGAWWIPFVVVGVLSFLLSIPYLMFPKWLSDSHLVREERRKEMAKVYKEELLVEQHNFKTSFKKFFTQIKRLLINPSFMFASFGLASIYIFTQGVISFAPKYLENQFYLTSSTAGLVTGIAAIPASVFGVFVGSFLLYLFKWNARQNIIAVTVVTMTSLPFLLTYIFHCPEISLVGITTEYDNGSLTDIGMCSSECNCSSTIFEPVCGDNGVTYFSACSAGCSEENNDLINLQNCSCIYTDPYNGADSFLFSSNATAVGGKCESTCILIVPAIIMFVISIIFAFISSIPYQYFILRVVSDEQRALALGLQSAIWRIFGAVPGPLLFGYLFDLSCAVWQEQCDRRGNCWIYHNDKLSIYATSVAFPCVTVGGILFVLAVLTFPKDKLTTESDDTVSNSEM